MNNLQLLWAGLLGWMVFSHMPDMLSMVGMCVITASGALIAVKSRPVKSKV
jgi:drug/metabolite transporter (DMT)-like permease